MFGNANRNLARRFISLVNVCREDKVLIVMRKKSPSLDRMFENVYISRSLANAMVGLQF